MRLSQVQKNLLVRMLRNGEYDNCGKGSMVTMRSLVNKGLAKYTSGFGYKYGEIIEFTEEGRKLADRVDWDRGFEEWKKGYAEWKAGLDKFVAEGRVI